MKLRQQIEAAPDNIYKKDPIDGEESDDRYSLAIVVMAKYFLTALDRIKNFDASKDYTESALSHLLWEEIKDEVPSNLRAELSGEQMYAAAHMAYQAYIGN